MKTTEFNEIVFENRNKEYGAYSLRKSYKKRMTIAVSISIIMLLMAVSYPLIAGYLNRINIVNSNTDVSVELLNNVPPDDVAPPPPPPPPPSTVEKYVKFTAPIVVDEDSVDTDFNNDPDKIVNKPIDTLETITDVVDTTTHITIIDIKPPIFIVVEEMPEYIGGDDARIKFISENVVYPTMARESNIQGTVYVTFVVETDGSITDVKILRGIGGGCDEEAIRVVKIMPKWKPGKQTGKNVRVQFNLPIKFTLI